MSTSTKKFRLLTDEEAANGAELWATTGGECAVIVDAVEHVTVDAGEIEHLRVAGVLVGAEDIHDKYGEWRKMRVYVRVGSRIHSFNDERHELTIEALMPTEETAAQR